MRVVPRYAGNVITVQRPVSDQRHSDFDRQRYTTDGIFIQSRRWGSLFLLPDQRRNQTHLRFLILMGPFSPPPMPTAKRLSLLQCRFSVDPYYAPGSRTRQGRGMGGIGYTYPFFL